MSCTPTHLTLFVTYFDRYDKYISMKHHQSLREPTFCDLLERMLSIVLFDAKIFVRLIHLSAFALVMSLADKMFDHLSSIKMSKNVKNFKNYF